MEVVHSRITAADHKIQLIRHERQRNIEFRVICRERALDVLETEPPRDRVLIYKEAVIPADKLSAERPAVGGNT